MKEDFDIDFINKYLQRGERVKLAKDSGISYQYASNCLNKNKKSFHLTFMINANTKAIEVASIVLARKEQTQSLKTVLQ